MDNKLKSAVEEDAFILNFTGNQTKLQTILSLNKY